MIGDRQTRVEGWRAGELLSASKLNRINRLLLSLGISDVDGMDRTFIPNIGTLLKAANNAQLSGGNLTGGLRMKCVNRESRTIPAFSVVQIDGDNPVPAQPAGTWPRDPGVFVRRPKEASLSGKVGWVDQEIAGDAEGQVIVGGWAVIWIRLYNPATFPVWASSPHAVGYRPSPGSDTYYNHFCNTTRDSYRMWTGPVGPFMLLWARYYASEPDIGWHPEVGDLYQDKWMGVVAMKSWWG